MNSHRFAVFSSASWSTTTSGQQLTEWHWDPSRFRACRVQRDPESYYIDQDIAVAGGRKRPGIGCEISPQRLSCRASGNRGYAFQVTRFRSAWSL